MEETKEEQNTSGSEGSDQNKSTGGSSGGGSTGNLFAVGESQDKGLADMETGSEVYMSELLVSDLLSRLKLEANNVLICMTGRLRHGGL